MKKRKLKIRKSISRRIKITGTGKLLRRRGFARHLKFGKSKGRIRALKVPTRVRGKLEKKLKQVLGLG